MRRLGEDGAHGDNARTADTVHDHGIGLRLKFGSVGSGRSVQIGTLRVGSDD